jgi:hypothetical protein
LDQLRESRFSGFFVRFTLGHGGDNGRAGNHGDECECYEKVMHGESP